MSNPRRRMPVTPSAHGAGNGLTLKTNMVLRSATFHSPPSPLSPDSECDDLAFTPPSLPRRSQTNLDDVVDAHRRRVALTLGNIDKDLIAAAAKASPSSTPSRSFRDTSLSVPQGILDHTIMAKAPETDRVLRRSTRRPARYHESDSGLGTSIETTSHKHAANQHKENVVTPSAITRSAAAPVPDKVQGLSSRATNRILEHTLKPLLAKPSLKDFHPVVLACPNQIQRKEIVCLRDLEKTLLLIAPERTKVAELYLEFCLTSIRCIQATVHYLSDREQTRDGDAPYSNRYFIDLVDQIRQYAQQIADTKEKTTDDKMDVDSSDEIKLHGGISINGRPAELVRIKKDGKAISLATGQLVELDEDTKNFVRVKRSASEELEDEEEIMRSMARRKKNAPPEEYAPKMCGVPGCNKEFKRPCDLTKHEKTHSRPWKCDIPSCKYHTYGWPTEKERDRHMNDKHAANPTMYNCQYNGCHYKSKRESNCKQHMEKAHGWTYVRTKNNGKNRNSISGGSPAMPTPPTHSMPTPVSDSSVGVATPPREGLFFGGIEFPIQDLSPLELPQELQLDQFDYSPIDNATPSTDASALDHSSAFQDMTTDLTMYDDIYAAPAHMPTDPLQALYGAKTMAPVSGMFAYSTAEQTAAAPAPHFSPNGHNSMLFTPTSMPDLDEGFVEDYDGNGVDFVLFPPDASKQVAFDQHAMFEEIPPSLAAGYSQPNSQNIPLMEWQQDYHHSGFSQ